MNFRLVLIARQLIIPCTCNTTPIESQLSSEGAGSADLFSRSAAFQIAWKGPPENTLPPSGAGFPFAPCFPSFEVFRACDIQFRFVFNWLEEFWKDAGERIGVSF